MSEKKLSRTDIRKFSKATPKLIGSAIGSLWDPDKGVAVPSCRIIQDIHRLKENFFLIVQDDGKVVPGVCDRNGHRKKSTGDEDGRNYWPRLEDQSAEGLDKIDLHEDCIEVVRELYFSRKEKFNNRNEGGGAVCRNSRNRIN